MKVLDTLLQDVLVTKRLGASVDTVSSIVFDSRKVEDGVLFVAQKGVLSDGHLFIDKAISLGATVVVCEDLPSEINSEVHYVQVKDSNIALAVIASNYYDNPSSKLKLVGVTGTNGKTTVASLLYALFEKGGYKTGLLSTVKVMVSNVQYPATHTTPDSLAINAYLAKMVDEGVTHCFMEVSSHGIHQSRTEGLCFDGGVFTNLSHDHLDYHKTFAAYRDVKKQFFDTLSKDAFALANVDDRNGKILLQNTKAQKKTYALKSMADYTAKVVEKNFSGMLMQLDTYEVWVRLIGGFNAYNLLSVYAVAKELGFSQEHLLTELSSLQSVDGRFEYRQSSKGIITIVDYAHTPDALQNVLETISEIRSGKESLITVMGCGGDRDNDKRSKMGNIASVMSDQVVFTSDNPRFEDPNEVLLQIEQGVQEENQYKVLSIVDRRQAIKTALRFANQGDIVLVAGKGHENYQDIKGVKIHFDDKEVIAEVLKELNK
ncbi:MAG: UDP-N-acetylmuramoyl-L-alanyl-D-glutamate--2,6-diaminopimelate ligase [Flavicella sp.]